MVVIHSKPDLAKWGSETLETIRRDFYMPKRRLYGDSVTPGKRPTQVAFNWGCGVMLSALAAGSRTDPKYDPWLREFADRTRAYWNTKPPVAGYDVLPAPKPVDRYYDDNAWMAMALVETYERLGDRKYLDWARETLTYVLSGEDEKLGGGIYWKEDGKTSKNTCSNAPSAAACLAVYKHTHEPALLAKARDLYAWTRRNLMDPSDHLMWDSINLSGKKDLTKWSYNTALMIRTASGLYEQSKLPSYRDDALAFERASKERWLRDGRLHDVGRFAHLLLESWLFRREAIPDEGVSLEDLVPPLTYLHEQARSAAGHYPDSWSGGPPKPDQKVELIDQASFARACFMLAGASR
jgi:hypothetical protein